MSAAPGAGAPCERCGTTENVARSDKLDVTLCGECFAELGDGTLAAAGIAPAAGRHVIVTRASAIKPRRVRWAWAERIALGAVALLSGRQGLGKSTLIASVAADVSRGRLPGDLQGEPADVLLVNYEDHPATTITPRLLAADADPDRVHILGASEQGIPDLLSLPDDLERIAEHARRLGARLLAIDPLVAALPGKIDSHRDQDVRRCLAPLAQLAEAADLAVIAAIHLRKGGAPAALDRVSGSVAFTAAARSVLAFGADPADDGDDGPGRVLAHAKSNVGPLAPSLAYRIEPATAVPAGEQIATSRLVLVGESEAQARELLSPPAPADRTDTEAAADWLADELADGNWHPSRELKARAKQADHFERTLKRAANLLGVEVDRRGFPAVSNWRLAVGPTAAGPPADPSVGPTGNTRISSRDSASGQPQLGQVADSGPTDGNGHRDGTEIDRLIAEAEEVEREAAQLGLAEPLQPPPADPTAGSDPLGIDRIIGRTDDPDVLRSEDGE